MYGSDGLDENTEHPLLVQHRQKGKYLQNLDCSES